MLNELNNPAFMDAFITVMAMATCVLGLGVCIASTILPVPAPSRRKR